MRTKKNILCAVLCFAAVMCGAQGFVIVESVTRHELNPQVTSYSSDSQILNGLFEGLFSYNPLTLEPDYAIASGFKISRDKKRWTITLRENARFSNGEAITAASVRYSWLHLLATKEAPYASLLDIIENAENYRSGLCAADDVGISVLDDRTLAVRLTAPANYLPRLLCHSAFSIVHRIPTVYSGAYMLEDQDEKSYLLKKNPYYWDAQNVQLDEITFLQSNDDAENAFLFNTGNADWVINNVNVDMVLNKNAVQVGGEFGTSYYFFKLSSQARGKTDENPADFNPWDFPEFRNAVMEAVPWDALRANAAVPAKTFVYPLTGYDAPDGFDYTDTDEAVRMMNAAREKHNISLDKALPLVFEVSEFTLSDEKKDALKNALSPLGVELVIREIPSSFYLANVPNSTADLFAYTWVGDFADPLAFLELFRGGSSLNDSGWSDPEYDALIDRAASASDFERNRLLSQAEKILLDSGMVIPIFHPVSFNLINLSETGGWSVNAFDIHPLKYLYRKESKKSIRNLVMR